jgi:hypothetical protein
MMADSQFGFGFCEIRAKKNAFLIGKSPNENEQTQRLQSLGSEWFDSTSESLKTAFQRCDSSQLCP